MSCQSCGMPLDSKVTSKFDKKYCIHCQDQETGKLKPYNLVKEGCIKAAIEYMGKSREEATESVEKILPTLPRWKDQK